MAKQRQSHQHSSSAAGPCPCCFRAFGTCLQVLEMESGEHFRSSRGWSPWSCACWAVLSGEVRAPCGFPQHFYFDSAFDRHLVLLQASSALPRAAEQCPRNPPPCSAPGEPAACGVPSGTVLGYGVENCKAGLGPARLRLLPALPACRCRHPCSPRRRFGTLRVCRLRAGAPQ